jgi:serine/threonine-protein kinase
MADTLDMRKGAGAARSAERSAPAAMRCPECASRYGVDAVFCPFDGTRLVAASSDGANAGLAGRVIDGRYEVVGALGEGGMGTVYKVRHTTLDRFFAMKVMRPDLARDPDLAARFLREARATASVKHPNVVAINDFGRLEGDQPYFVMENLVGQTLARAIKAGGAVPAATGVRVALKIAAAVGAAHAASIVHRDLKPDNVFLVGEGPDVDVRVVDFGAALVLGASRVTKAGVVFGTPHYMSPEQASGQPVDHRADIYALGVIMYEMFTGRVPFVADTYMGVLTQHMFAKPPRPTKVADAARWLGPLEAVILRALEKKPEDRQASMEELAAEVQRASLRGEGAARAGSSRRSAAASARASGGETSAELVAVTGSEVRRRRAQARAWVTYAGVALAVAVVTVGVFRLTRPHDGIDPAPAAGVSALPSATAVAPAALVATPTPAPTPQATASPPASPSQTPRPTSAPRSARSTNPPPKKPPPSMSGDFADPWAR